VRRENGNGNEKEDQVMKKRIHVFGIMVAGMLIHPVGAELIVTLKGANQMEDTSLRGDNSQSTAPYNYGGWDTVVVGRLPDAGSTQVKFNSLLRFTDFSDVPAGYTVTGAKLRLYNLNNANQTAGVSINVYELAAANAGWVEGSSIGVVEAGSSCWRFQKQNTVNWAGGQNGAGVAGTDYTTNLVGSAIAADTTQVWVDFTLDAAVIQKWINNPAENYGIILTALGANVGEIAYFGSSEYGTASVRPELVLTVIPEPATLGLFIVAGACAVFARNIQK